MKTKLHLFLLPLFLFVFIVPSAQAQVVIWNEDFTLPDNTETDVGTTAWTESVNAQGSTDAGSVQGNVFRWEDVDGETSDGFQAIWLSQSIDISSYTNIEISADVRGLGGLDAGTDYIILEYRIDLGAWTPFMNNGFNDGNFSTTFITSSTTTTDGVNLEIRVRVFSTADDEIHQLDNVLVEGILRTGATDPNCIAPLAPPTFTEVAATTGGLNVGGVKDGGTAWGDFNKDNCLDLLVNTQNDGTQLFQSNCDGTFFRVPNTRVPAELGTTNRERSAIWGDINNDGFLDFARNTSATGANNASIHIYLNDGIAPNNSFILIQTICSGSTINGVIAPGAIKTADINNGRLVDGQNTEGLGWLDYNNDGYLDLVIENHNCGIDIFENQFYWGKLNRCYSKRCCRCCCFGRVINCDHPSNPTVTPQELILLLCMLHQTKTQEDY